MLQAEKIQSNWDRYISEIITREDAINHIQTNQGDMKINYEEVFGIKS